MAGYLTTEQLVNILNSQTKKISDQPNIPPETTFRTKRKKNVKRIIYLIFLGLAILHVIYATIPLVSPSHALNIFGYQYILAIPNDQDLDDTLYARVVSIRPFRLEDIQVGDKILIYGRYGSDFYWVEDVVDIYDDETLDATFDGVIRNRYDFEDIYAVVVQEANIFGSLIYVSSSLRGYVALLGTYIVIFGLTYYFYVREKKQIKKPL